jgi:hypothetical protein
LIVASLGALLGLSLYGTPLLSVTSWQTTPSGQGPLTVVVTAAGFHVHWPLLAVGAAALGGLVALVWPDRRPPRLQT